MPGKTAEKKKRPHFRARGGFDVPFLMIVLILLGIGLIMMFSASYTYAYYYNGDSFFYIKKQAFFAVAGIIVMFLVSKIDYQIFKPLALILLPVSYVLLVLVLFVSPPAGYEEFHRWITIPGVTTFQPSEIAKLAIILFFAWHIDKHWDDINSPAAKKTGLITKKEGSKGGITLAPKTVDALIYLFVLFTTCILIYKENHVSGTILVFFIGIMMIYLGGYDKKWFLICFALVAVVAIAVIKNPSILPAHATVRITAWLDKDYDPLGTRWQTNQALYAIGSGGFFGVGLGNSKEKHLYVSEPQNDFIFSIVCEELGFVGAVVILILFGALVYRGFIIASRSKDRFGAMTVMGIVFQVGLQTALNIAVVTDTIPNTGISLPFFSYGGTSLLMLLFEMGIVLSVSRTARIKKV